MQPCPPITIPWQRDEARDQSWREEEEDEEQVVEDADKVAAEEEEEGGMETSLLGSECDTSSGDEPARH